MQDRSVVIIGAGLAGLATGCFAQMNGYESHIFYMAGQWVMPGGGVPPCLYSGRHAVQLLCHRDGKPFVSSVP